jgi:hypothetical protein
MGAEAVSIGIPQLALVIFLFGVLFMLFAAAVARRYGRRGLVLVWLVTSLSVAAVIGYQVAGTFPGSSEGAVSFYLIPLLFFAVQLGLVALYLSRSSRRRPGAVRQFSVALLVFFATTVPAALVAVLPDAVRLFSRGTP